MINTKKCHCEGVIVDATECKQAEEKISTTTFRQKVLVELGLRALSGIDLSALMDETVAVVAETEVAAVETVVVRPPSGMRDGFMYTITIDHQTRQYWVERSGGIAGRRERRGPLSCAEPPVLPPAKPE